MNKGDKAMQVTTVLKTMKENKGSYIDHDIGSMSSF
jgi:hypothetical protein